MILKILKMSSNKFEFIISILVCITNFTKYNNNQTTSEIHEVEYRELLRQLKLLKRAVLNAKKRTARAHQRDIETLNKKSPGVQKNTELNVDSEMYKTKAQNNACTSILFNELYCYKKREEIKYALDKRHLENKIKPNQHKTQITNYSFSNLDKIAEQKIINNIDTKKEREIVSEKVSSSNIKHAWNIAKCKIYFFLDLIWKRMSSKSKQAIKTVERKKYVRRPKEIIEAEKVEKARRREAKEAKETNLANADNKSSNKPKTTNNCVSKRTISKMDSSEPKNEHNRNETETNQEEVIESKRQRTCLFDVIEQRMVL